MKNKKKMAFALISVLSLSALTLSVFADTPTIDNGSKTTTQENQKKQQLQQRESEKRTTIDATDNSIADSETGDKTEISNEKSGRHPGKHPEEQIAEPENAIGKDSAQAKALEDAGVTADQADRVMTHLSQLDDGTVVYMVHFIFNDQHFSYQINATTGDIVDKSTNSVEEDKMEDPRGHGKHDIEQIAEPKNAIGKDSAQAKALEDAGVTADQVDKVMTHLSQLDDGTVVYMEHFIYNDQHFSYQINATTGDIVDKSTNSVEEDKMENPRGHGKHDIEQIAEPENAIGKDSAQAKALEDAGVTADQAGRIMTHLSQLDDGTVVYMVHFIFNDQHYSYKINATTGVIVDKSTNSVEEDKMEDSRGHGGHDKKNESTTDSSTKTTSAVA